jgi:hypothetical protein
MRVLQVLCNSRGKLVKPGETTKNLCGAADGGELSVYFSSFLCCPKAISCCFQQRFDRKGSTSDENVVAKKDTLGTAAGQRACGSSACIHIHANVCAVVTTGVPIRGWACACDTHFYGDRCQFGCVPVRETAVLAPFYTANDRFCQDRLGTNIRNVEKKRMMRFFCRTRAAAATVSAIRSSAPASATRTFSARTARCAKRLFGAISMYSNRNDHFAKTGSGQT